MKKTKELFLVTALICVLSTLINVVYAVDSFVHSHIFNGLSYIIFSIAGVACVVAFIFFKKQTDNFLIEHKNWVLTFSIVALVCSMLGGIIAFYAYSTMYAINQNDNAKQYGANKAVIVDGVEIINDKKMANYIDKANRLEELKNNGTITNEQYEILKQQALNEYLNKGDD